MRMVFANSTVMEPIQESFLGSPTAGMVINLCRGELSRIEILDSAGVRVDSALWAGDLGAGTVILSTPLHLDAYELPLIIRHYKRAKGDG